MSGITIAEKDHSVVITVDTDIIDRWRVEQALSLLEIDDADYSHIPSASAEEQADIAYSLMEMTDEDRKYTSFRSYHPCKLKPP